MAYDGQQILVPGLVAGADMSAVGNQYKFVKLSAAKTVVLCDGTTDKPIGVLQNRPNTGETAQVCAIGITKVQGDADLSFASTVGTSADGQAAIYAAADTTKSIVGIVVEDNAAAGGFATIIVNVVGRLLA